MSSATDKINSDSSFHWDIIIIIIIIIVLQLN